MTLAFYIAHTTIGRTRIRWAGDASEKSGIIGLAAKMETLDAIEKAEPREATGSIIIEHEQTEWSVLQPQLQEQFSLDFISTTPAVRRTGTQVLNQGLDSFDSALKNVNMDLGSVALVALSSMAIVQALRGQVTSPAGSYLWYALSLVAMARDKAGDAAANTAENID